MSALDSATAARADALARHELHTVHCMVDRMFGWLLGLQWLFAIGCALVLSPRTWTGSMSSVHPHLLAAIVLGGLITVLPLAMIIWRPGMALTRHIVASAQTLYSALLIHLMGGRIETHFHLFGSLAFLAFYRDWRVLVTGTIIIAADHGLRGVVWPQSVYGIDTMQPWRFIEHVAWVLFEDIVLVGSCIAGVRSIQATATERAVLEATKNTIEEQVAQRSQELARREELFRSIVSAAQEGIWMIDRDAHTTFVNQRMAEMLGYTVAEMQGRSMRDFIDMEVAASGWRAFQGCQRGVAGQFELQFVHRLGHQVWASISASPVRDDQGGVIGSLALVTDISQRRDEESRHRRIHAETELLVSSINAVLIGIDGLGRICRWNEVAVATFGHLAHEVEGRTLESLALPWDAHGVDGAIRRCLESGEPGHAEVRFTRDDGSAGYLDLAVCPSQRRTEGGLRYLLLGSDITERKVMEAQRAQGQKLESVGQLAAGIAHEINTPIQFVGDNLRFLMDAFRDFNSAFEVHRTAVRTARDGGDVQQAIQAADEATQRYDIDYLHNEAPKAVSQALEGVDRVATIVRALKEYSHPDSQSMQSVDLARVIQSTLTVARNEYKYVADLFTEFAPDMPQVRCMPGELNQVVLNLVINAAHAIGDAVQAKGGRGRIDVSLAREGEQAVIRIADSGTGIPEAIRTRIFDPFFTTKPVGKGTGQGLYIAREIIVRKHRGSIDVESRPGEGTTFIIRIPIAGAEEETSHG